MKHKVFTNEQIAVVDPAVQFGGDSGVFKQGWQLIVTADASAGNGQGLTVRVFGGHTVNGTTEYAPIHTEVITTADMVKPDGTTEAGRASLMVQDPWGKYDDIQVRLEGTGTWTLRSSLRTPDASF